MNRLYFGDCLTVMQDMPKWSVDLIYLDPPFNSQRQYNNIYKDATGRPLPDQVIAFNDMWILDDRTEEAIRHMPVLMRQNGIDDATTQFWQLWMNALRDTNPRLLAYLSYMVQRLLQMKVILKPTGSLYLHCDPTVSHYIKVMMDAVFGHQQFKNEIIWSYRRWPSKSNHYQTMHDVILFYTNGRTHTFHVAYEPPSESYLKRFKGKTQILDPDTKTRKIVIDEPTKGLPQRDVWSLSILAGSSKERLGYRTQKPLALLERIIMASSNPGDLVLDPFAGCATTLEAAQKLGRRWIGIDIAVHAINTVARRRLTERLGLVEGVDFEVSGVPQTAEGALELWRRDPHQFQTWAVELADGFVTRRKSGDGGVDGRLYFDVPGERLHHSMVIEVKGGRTVNISTVRDLRGVLEREPLALLAGLIVQHPLGQRQRSNFAREMGKAGAVEIDGVEYPRMQLLTVPELLAGKQFDTPRAVGRHEPQPALPGISRD